MSYETVYQHGRTFSEFLDEAQVNAELWAQFAARARLDEPAAERIGRAGGRWRLLVLTDDWCGDAMNTLPLIARLAEASENVELRIVPRDAYPDVRDRHLTNGSRSSPMVLLLDQDGDVLGSWGPRPKVLQALFERELRPMPSKERYRELRKWYARDRGASTVREIADLFEPEKETAGPVPLEI